MLLAVALLALAQPAPPQTGRLIPLPDDAVAYIPGNAPAHPPLLVLLHGAGHRQLEMVQHFEAEADKRGIVLLAPSSRGVSWDSVLIAEEPPSPDSPLGHDRAQRFGRSRDAGRVEAAIANLSKIVPVDRAHTVLAGFSDGATFALAMGLSRDYPFSAVIAWSPGIAIETEGAAKGRRVFVSHGRQDPLLAFQVTCGDVVPLLKNEGANVTFLPFDGAHDAPLWLKDTFLDAAFGRVAGSKAVPLPASAPVCHGTAPSMPEMPQPATTMMGPG